MSQCFQFTQWTMNGSNSGQECLSCEPVIVYSPSGNLKLYTTDDQIGVGISINRYMGFLHVNPFAHLFVVCVIDQHYLRHRCDAKTGYVSKYS